MPVSGFVAVTYIMWSWGKKGAFWTAVDLQEDKFTFLQKREEILSEKHLGKNEVYMLRQNGWFPNLWPMKQTWNGNFLWNTHFSVRSWEIKAQQGAAVRPWAPSLQPLQDCCFSQDYRKEESSGLYFNSPAVPQAPSASVRPQISGDIVDLVEEPLSCRRCNSMVPWEVGHKVSKGRFSVTQPLFLQLLKSSVQEWLVVSTLYPTSLCARAPFGHSWQTPLPFIVVAGLTVCRVSCHGGWWSFIHLKT